MKCNVKEKTVPFEFDGKTFRLKFNLNVIAEIQEKYEDLDSFFVYMGLEECLILDKNSFVEGTDINFKELLTAVAGLKKEENGDEY